MTERDLQALEYRADEKGECNPGDILRLIVEVRRLREELEEAQGMICGDMKRLGRCCS